MSNYLKATPSPHLLGINDISRRPTPPAPVETPQHFPHFYIFAERGPLGAIAGGGDDIKEVFGRETFMPNGKYSTHQSRLATKTAGRQQVFIERLMPPGAKTGMLRLCAEVITTEVPQYERNSSTGGYVLDQDGNPVESGTVLTGHEVRWLLSPSSMSTFGFGEAETTMGDMTGTIDTEVSTIYPVMDLMISSFGEWGNRVGLRIGSPITRGPTGGNGPVMEAMRAYMYRFQVVERSATGTPQVWPALGGDDYVEMALKPGAVNPLGNIPSDFANNFIDRYRDVDTVGVTRRDGPYEELFFYETEYNALVDRLLTGTNPTAGGQDADGEQDFDEALAGHYRIGANAMANPENKYMLNPFSGRDYNGMPYFSFIVNNDNPGVIVSANSALYAQGGDDGDLSPTAFDMKVYEALDAYGSMSEPTWALDWAAYPFSDYYDTGFTMRTKFAMLDLMGKRKDIKVSVTPQELFLPSDLLDPNSPLVPNTRANDLILENANTVQLSNYARSIPESVLYGTEACRFFIVQQAGYVIGDAYTGLTPVMDEFVEKRSVYMGAGTGIWDRAQNPQIYPNNTITRMRKINLTYRESDQYDNAWNAGAIWVQNADMKTQFFPALHSGYRYADSVLQSMGFVDCCVELQKVCLRSWVRLSGGDHLTDLEFKEASDALLAEMGKESRFANRYRIIPNTVITADDSARGYTWAATFEVYGNKMRLVGRFTVQADDMNALLEMAA